MFTLLLLAISVLQQLSRVG